MDGKLSAGAGGRDREIEKSLQSIYERDRASDWSRLERRRSRRWLAALLALIGFGALASGAAWAGFLLFQPFRQFHGQGLLVLIDGPEQITLGQEQHFRIRWSDQDAQDLEHAEVRVSFPPDFRATSLQPPPADAAQLVWNAGRLAPGHGSSVEVAGVFGGALGAQSAIQALGTYRPLGFSRDFESLVVKPLHYGASVLETRLIVPEQTFVGDTIAIRFQVFNHGGAAMHRLFARLTLPAGFLVAGGASTTDAGELFVPLGDLPSGASTTASLNGSFVSGVSGDGVFEGEAGTRDLGIFVALQKIEARFPVLSGDLTIHLVVNGGDASRTILPGDPLHITLGYQNTSPETLKNVSLKLSFESLVEHRSATGTSLLDWGSLDDPAQGASSTRSRIQTLSYDKNILPTLAQLEPQSEGSVDVTLPSLPAASGTSDAAILVTAEASVPVAGASRVNRRVVTAPLTMRYGSDADLAVEARYFTEEGAPIGFGPLPPVAGKATGYRIFWRITKTLHALDQVNVSAVLPPNAVWEGKPLTSVGTVVFDSATRTVHWQADQISEMSKAEEASFLVRITPEPIDIGRFVDLLGETSLQAQDPLIGENISRSKPALSTDVETDPGARGKGVVRQE